MWLPLMLLVLGTWPATHACALTGNRTGDPLVSRSTLNPLSHTSRGRVYVFNLYKKWAFHVDKMYLVPSSLITLCCYFRFLLFTLFCLLSLIFCLSSKRKKQVPLKNPGRWPSVSCLGSQECGSCVPGVCEPTSSSHSGRVNKSQC